MKQSRWMQLCALIVATSLAAVACTKANSHSITKAEGESEGRGNQTVIYGEDNRVDYYAADASVRALSESTVALMSASQIGKAVNGMHPLNGVNYGTSLGLCSDERFIEQNTGAFCSGFLIAPDLIVTAGHCVPDLKSCGETSYVFGFHIAVAGQLPTSISSNEVYNCASLVHTQSPSDGADFAIVKLDRAVPNHKPLDLRSSGDIANGTELTVMGYPEGLPLKIADGAAVRNADKPGFFVANTDTYGGNSGSAVINSSTHQVEGVLVRGEKDFEWSDAGCAKSYRCKADACRGEDITKISEISKTLTALGL